MLLWDRKLAICRMDEVILELPTPYKRAIPMPYCFHITQKATPAQPEDKLHTIFSCPSSNYHELPAVQLHPIYPTIDIYLMDSLPPRGCPDFPCGKNEKDCE